MWQLFTALTFLVSSIAAGKIEQSSCMLVADYTSWDLRGMSAVKESGNFQYYTSGNVTWNLCSYIKFEDTPQAKIAHDQGGIQHVETFAYLTTDGYVYPLTDDMIPAAEAHTDAAGDIDGITYTYTSTNNMCLFDTSKQFGFKNTVMCNKDITDKGSARIVSVTGQSSCMPTVVMEHAEGCEVVSFKGFVKFMDENAWLSGTILAVFGVVMVFFGRVFFQWIMAAIGTLAGFSAIMYLTSLFGWLGATWSLIVWIILAVVIGAACGFFTYKMLPISIGLLGAAGGFVGGAALFSLILSISGYDELWLLIVLIIIGLLGFGLLAYKFRYMFLSLTSSIVGGYMFMRGLTFWFGHYPSEGEMFSMMTNGQHLELEWQFWLYFACFVVTSIFGFVWQTKYYTHQDKFGDDFFENANYA